MLALSGRPLLEDAEDEALFVDREEVLEQASRAARQGVNVLLVGPRGSGKTSTLHRLARTLRGEKPVVVLDGRAASDAADLLRLLRWKLGGRPASDQLAELELLGRGAEGETERLLALVHAVEQRLANQTLALLLDEVPHPADARRLFGQLRDELWRLPLIWVVAAEEADRASFLRPPADAFFGRVLSLGPLPRDASRQLLQRRAPQLGSAALDLLAFHGQGNPRRLVELARQVVVEGRSPDEVAEAQSRRVAILEDLGEAARRLHAELEASGGASMSDPALLGRLGWSRPRAQQVVSELEAAGLVEADILPAVRGRPRKLYRLRQAPMGSPEAGA